MAPSSSPDTGPETVPAAGPVDLISHLRQTQAQLAARERRVADYVLAHLPQITDMTIAELAAACEVSTPTVVRFCRSLGIEGFRAFKLRLAQNLAVSLQYLQPEGEPASDATGAVDQILGALSATLNVMRRQLDAGQLQQAITHLVKAGHEAGQVVVAGLGGGSSMLAQEASNRLFRLGLTAMAVSDSYLLQMRAATLGPGDVLLLISASGAPVELTRAAEIAGGYGATTLALTRPDSPLAALVDVAVTAALPEDPDIHKPTASRYAHLVLVDALAMGVAQARPADTNENLRRIRASLTAYHGRTGPQPLGD